MRKPTSQRIKMQNKSDTSIVNFFPQYLTSCSAQGFSGNTINTYRTHLNCIGKYLDTSLPLSALTKSDVEEAIKNMRKKGLAHNSIASYMRSFRAFISWCKEEKYLIFNLPFLFSVQKA